MKSLNVGDTYAGAAMVWTVDSIYFSPSTVVLTHPLADEPWELSLVDFEALVARDVLTFEPAQSAKVTAASAAMAAFLAAEAAIPPVALALWGDGEHRSFDLGDVQVWYQRRREVYLPVVQTACFVCHTHAEPGAQGVSVSRISGDSRYGYESYHGACL